MGDIAEKRSGNNDLAEEQSCSKKHTILKPLPVRASANVPLGASGSSFKPWKKPSANYINGLYVAVASMHSETKPNIAHAENENNQIMESSTSNSEEKLNIGLSATSGYVTETGEGQVNQLGLDCSFKSEIMDPKLKRVISNRLSAQKSRLKRNACLADLESKAKYFKEHIAFLYRQIEAQKNRNQLLQIEQHQLKLHMATCEKQRVLDEVVIEKNKAEVERLKELQLKKLAAEAPSGSMMLNLGGSVQIVSNSNLDHSSLGRLAPCKNSPALNGVGTSKVQVDNAQQ
ncbi:hypothetical protein Lal_00048236 [Lupinus albus]|nr:hypothetical protein Lal_00048236 [Lupinus albus]